ncbi:hypothetical protein [Paenibacillus sp. NEAU-GSW1]|uniref:hypothetical protein n=1 Tax=Paenibacillus sp. NEAU-GSW1 TaxID=2682486 RepID=UPI0012E0E8D4|nr:hypothetical protein [Paenibacillus sp. NEAU-GSW1]MUT66481.1 hypothetical protein [Paenibacillus sp. NEAU-GSW1]
MQGIYNNVYAFHHYAASAARFIACDAVYEALAGNTDESDEQLLQGFFSHWNARSFEQLYAIAATGFEADRRERDKRFGQLAPLITSFAAHISNKSWPVYSRTATGKASQSSSLH